MRILFVFLFVVSALFAQSSKLSHIPPTKNIFLDLDESTCDQACLASLLEEGQIFSFLSKYNNLVEDENIKNEFLQYRALFRVLVDERHSIRLAVLVPQKSIRRYAISTVNSIIAYMLTKEFNFEIKVFNSTDEKEESILNALQDIKNENFQFVIAPLTNKGADTLIKNSHNLLVYLPTIHKSEYPDINSNVIFGGIDYEGQIKKLLPYANRNVALFSDGSELSKNLNNLVENLVPVVRYSKVINNSKVSFKSIFRYNKKIDDSSIFLNTPLVKSSLIASQIRVYKKEPYALLSTQINYNPLLLTLTQYEDRKNFYLANSIGKTSVKIEETNSLFGHNITYDWVNYSTSIGIDYIYTHYLSPTNMREFSENIVDNQVQYNISILKPKRYKFAKELF